MSLYPHQTQAMDDCRAAYRDGKRRVILQAATGFGKTRVAAECVRSAVERQKRVLYTTHRIEIHKQTLRELQPLIPVAELTAGGQPPPWPEGGGVLLASLQTVSRRIAQGWVPGADLLVLDEAHTHYAALQRVQASCPQAWSLLLTATPVRLDNRPMSALADVIVRGPPMQWLVDNGRLCPVRCFGAETPDLHSAPRKGGDFDLSGGGMLDVAYRSPRLVGSAVEAWWRFCAVRRTVGFLSSVKASEATVAALCASGCRAVHVDATTPPALRERAFDDLRQHRIDYLANVGLAIEGLDIPELAAVHWLRPTDSVSIFLQGTGRGMRIAPWIGKVDCVVLDQAGNVYRHGLPTEEREWSLDGRVKRPPGAPALRTCAACQAIYEPADACPRCGAEPTPEQRKLPRVVGGELVELTAAELERRKRAASRDVPPRPAPAWVPASAKQRWERDEAVRAREGYALPGPDGRGGWTETRVRARIARDAGHDVRRRRVA